jgi:cbb3-type cytochrome oxidase subunit 3
MQPTDAPASGVSPLWLEIAMIMFIVIFLGIVAWACLAKSSYFRRAARIPLHDDEVVMPRDDDTGAGAAATSGPQPDPDLEVNHDRQ